MKKAGLFSALLVALFGLSVLFTSLAGAHSFRTGNTVSTPSGEVIDSTLFVAGKTITVESDVNGDVFCAGQTVVVSGNVQGDVICAAQTITISGSVDGDIRLASQTITLSGSVSGNSSIVTETFVQDSSSSIAGDVSIAASDATFSGSIGRDLAIAGGDVSVSGNVGRDIQGSVQDLVLEPGAVVFGDIEYTSENEVLIASGVQVDGQITQTIPEQSSSVSLFGVALVWLLYLLLAGLVISMALVLIAPRFVHSVTSQAYPQPWKALATGFVASVVVPFSIVLLLFTIVGIPLALIVGLTWLLFALMSGPFAAYLVGRWIMRDSDKPILLMLVGSLVLIFSYFVPIVGFFALVGAYWIGVGMLLLEAYSRYPKPVYNFAPATKKTAKKSSKK